MRAVVQSADARSARAWLVQQRRRRYARASFFGTPLLGRRGRRDLAARSGLGHAAKWRARLDALEKAELLGLGCAGAHTFTDGIGQNFRHKGRFRACAGEDELFFCARHAHEEQAALLSQILL